MSDGSKNGVKPIGKKNPNLPFHPGIRAGDYIFISGQVAKDENGNMFCGTIEEETRWTWLIASAKPAMRSPNWTTSSVRPAKTRIVSSIALRVSVSPSRGTVATVSPVA